MLLPDGTSTYAPIVEHFMYTHPSRHARLYASKDGEDLVYKLKTTTLYGFKCGTMFSLAEMVLNSNPSTMTQVGFRYLQLTVPITLMGAGFMAGVSMSAAITQKDGPLNHLIGGATSGAILSACMGNVMRGVKAGAVIGVLAAVNKACYDDGVALITYQETPKHRLMQTTGNVGKTWDPWRKETDIESLYTNKD